MHNHVILTGRLTADPELRQTPSGIYVCRFSLAVQRKYNKNSKERETDFIDVEAWKSNAEFISKYFRKGELMDISGRLKTSRWKDEKGDTHYQTSVLVESIEFAPTNNRKSEERSDRDGQGDASAGLSDFETVEAMDTPF